MQSVPGKDNGLIYKGNSLPNWWTFIADFDGSMKKGLKLVSETQNKAPVANSQSVTTYKNTPINITLTGSDPDNNPITYKISSQPTNGNLSGSAPKITYTPKTNFVGSDSFTFTVNDGSLDSKKATISITIKEEQNTGGKKLSIPEQSGSPGKDIIIPININDATGLAGADITVTYDKKILTFKQAVNTELFNGNFAVNDVSSDSKVVIRMASMKGIEKGSGALINMTFTVKANTTIGTETPINLTDVSAFDEIANSITISTQNGKLKIVSACVKGDVNGDGAIKSNDVILALRISAGLMQADQTQFCAADFNDDGAVKSNDAILILRKSAGMAPAIKENISIDTVKLFINDAYGSQGKAVNMPIMIDNPGMLGGGDIAIVYDSSVLRARYVTSSSGVILASNISNEGQIRLSFTNTEKLTGDNIAKIEFEVLVDSESPIKINKAELYDYDGRTLNSKWLDGKFRSYNIPAEKTSLLQNYPNPFNPETWIPYQLKESNEVKIVIYDVSGRKIRSLDLGYRNAGIYTTPDRSAYWDGKNESGETVTSGVYFYTIQAGSFTDTRKMIIKK